MGFLIAVLFIFSGIQLYTWSWDYRHTRNKSDFWSWQRFRQPVTLVSMIGGSILFANLLFPEVKLDTPEQKIEFGERFSRHELAMKGYMALGLENRSTPETNLRVLELFSQVYGAAEPGMPQFEAKQNARTYFKRLIESPQQSDRDMGHLGLGWVNTELDKLDDAAAELQLVSNEDAPYLHLAWGNLFYSMGSGDDAETQYLQEIALDGASAQSYKRLTTLYYFQSRITELDSMLQVTEVVEATSRWLAAERFFYQRDWISYYKMVFRRFEKSFNVYGALAAFIIMLVWMVYLMRVDVFKRENWRWVAVVAVLGMICTFGVESVSDFLNYRLEFTITGEFWNDFLYCVVGIGAVEELVKIVPLLLVISFTKLIREPYDYLLYASASALGFAFVENLLYINGGDLDNIQGRALMAVVSHMFDSSVIAYSMVLARYKFKKSPLIGLGIGYLVASLAHGFYDFWLIYEFAASMYFITLMFFLATMHLWGTMQNNALNQSPFFDLKKVFTNQNLRYFLATTLTGLIMLEFLVLGWNYGLDFANSNLFGEFTFGGFLIFYLASSLSQFDFVRGYWAPLNVPATPFMPAMKSVQNYVGYTIRLVPQHGSDKLNKYLPMDAQIIDRMVISNNPNYFLVELAKPLRFMDYEAHYALIRARNPFEPINDTSLSLVGFRIITSLEVLAEPKLMKRTFPFMGYVRAIQTGKQEVKTWDWEMKAPSGKKAAPQALPPSTDLEPEAD